MSDEETEVECVLEEKPQLGFCVEVLTGSFETPFATSFDVLAPSWSSTVERGPLREFQNSGGRIGRVERKKGDLPDQGYMDEHLS